MKKIPVFISCLLTVFCLSCNEGDKYMPIPYPSPTNIFSEAELIKYGWYYERVDSEDFFDPILDSDTLRVVLDRVNNMRMIELNRLAYIFAHHTDRWSEIWPENAGILYIGGRWVDDAFLAFPPDTPGTSFTVDFLTVKHSGYNILLQFLQSSEPDETRTVYVDLTRFPGGDHKTFYEREWPIATIEVKFEPDR